MEQQSQCRTLVSELDVNVLLEISRHLNPRMVCGGDWQSLAGHFGKKYIDIQNFALVDNPTMAVLVSWWGDTPKYVSDLLVILEAMERRDVCKILKPHEFYTPETQSQPTEDKNKSLSEIDAPEYERPAVLHLENGHTQSHIKGPTTSHFKGHASENSLSPSAYVVSGAALVNEDSQDELDDPEEPDILDAPEEAIVRSRTSQRAANVNDMSVQTQAPSPTAAQTVPHFPSPDQETTRIPDKPMSCLTAPHDKIALVIGNQNYHNPNYNKLSYPQNDAFDIESALSDLHFKVISLVDLTLTEMRTSMLAFCRLLGPGIFAVIYYAGHGFELDGENYLLPVDAKSPGPDESIRAQEFLQEMQNCGTLLNLMFLDCCRTRTKGSKNPRCSLKRGTHGNTIIAYSCCTQHGAFEEPDQKNGVYARFLLQNIKRDTRIENILMDVSTDVVASRSVDQRPTYESDAYMDCRLTAPIMRESENKMRERYDLWREGNRVPEPMTIPMDDAEINLCFHRGFSNVMITEMVVNNKGQREIKNFKFELSVYHPLEVEVMCEPTDIQPLEKKKVGGFRIFMLQKLYNENVFLSIDFQTDDGSILKKIDFGTPLITGITGSFHEWIKDRKYETPSGVKSSWI